MTPDDVRAEIIDTVNQLRKAPDAVQAAQVEAKRLALEAERAEAVAFLEANGNVEERKATAKIAAADHKMAAEVADAAYWRARTKTGGLRDSLSAWQSVLSSIMREGA